jgi:hypothetical protein
MRYLRPFFRLEIALIVMGTAGVILTLPLIGVLFFRPLPASTRVPTAIITVIPAPCATPSPISTLQPTQTVTTSAFPSPLPGVIAIGGYVQITGTGGDGLRLRSDPGLGNTIRFVAMESEVFLVLEGPQTADGLTWWYLTAPYDETRRGWAVSNYLATVNSP